VTRAERLHNLACRVLQGVSVVLLGAFFLADYHSTAQFILGLAAMLCLTISAVMGRYVEEAERDE
jgi:glucose uptake protein GlcU